MTIYILFYISILLLGAIFSTRRDQKRSRRIFCNIVLILMCLVMCLRDVSVGEDTAHYVEWYKDYCAMPSISSLFAYHRDVEIGYSLINYVLSRITSDPQVLIAVISIIIAFLHINFIRRNSKNVYMSVELYVALNFFFTSMNSWRQFIAMGICFWMFPLLLKRKYFKAAIMLLLGFCFHDTVIIFGITIFILALINRKKSRHIWVILGGILSFSFLPLLIQLFLKILPSYAEYFEGAGGGYIGELEIVFIVVQAIIIFYVLTHKTLYSDRRIILLASLLVCNIMVTIYGLFIPHIFRLNFYFKYFLILIIPDIICKMENCRRQRRTARNIGRLTSLGCCLLFGYYVSVNPGNVVPYKLFKT